MAQQTYGEWMRSNPPIPNMTAVDYLIEQLQAPCRGIPSHIIEQAKQMEKEQIEAAHLEGYKKAWAEANAELQKYVNQVTRYKSLKNQ